MKNEDKSKYYLDLSKCSEGEIKEASALTGYPIGDIEEYPFFYLDGTEWNQNMIRSAVHGKTEISFTDFKEMLGSGEEPSSRGQENGDYTAEDMEKAYRAGENKATYRLKDTIVILPNSYEGIEG